MGGSLCVFVDRWLKKGFYLQYLWTASNCLGDLFERVTRWKSWRQNKQRAVPV